VASLRVARRSFGASSITCGLQIDGRGVWEFMSIGHVGGKISALLKKKKSNGVKLRFRPNINPRAVTAVLLVSRTNSELREGFYYGITN
jgi:hypothetical protein